MLLVERRDWRCELHSAASWKHRSSSWAGCLCQVPLGSFVPCYVLCCWHTSAVAAWGGQQATQTAHNCTACQLLNSHFAWRHFEPYRVQLHPHQCRHAMPHIVPSRPPKPPLASPLLPCPGCSVHLPAAARANVASYRRTASPKPRPYPCISAVGRCSMPRLVAGPSIYPPPALSPPRTLFAP